MSRVRALPRPSVWLLTVALALAGLAGTGTAASATEPIHITGTVTGTGGVPVADVAVQAIVFCSCEGYDQVASVDTADDGTYDLVIAPITEPVLDHNRFYLRFSPSGDYALQYYDNAVSLMTADGIYVPDGGTASGKDVQLAPASHITGTVTAPDGTPIAGALVVGSFADPKNSGTLGEDFSTRTADDGSYDLSPPASTYTLRFSAQGYRRESYPTDVVLAAGKTVSRRDAQLRYSQHVDNLTRPVISGKPKVGRRVTAEPGSWDPSQVTTRYRWLVAGKPVVGATHASYRPRAADVGKTLRVRVTASATGFAAARATSAGKTVAKAP